MTVLELSPAAGISRRSVLIAAVGFVVLPAHHRPGHNHGHTPSPTPTPTPSPTDPPTGQAFLVGQSHVGGTDVVGGTLTGG